MSYIIIIISASEIIVRHQNIVKVVTANDLLAGDVIYFTEMDGWTRNHREAAQYYEESTAKAALQRAAGQPEIAVGVYLADFAKGGDGQPRPAHFREKFRVNGPSNYALGALGDVANVYL